MVFSMVGENDCITLRVKDKDLLKDDVDLGGAILHLGELEKQDEGKSEMVLELDTYGKLNVQIEWVV
jgi:hypothetical protein